FDFRDGLIGAPAGRKGVGGLLIVDCLAQALDFSRAQLIGMIRNVHRPCACVGLGIDYPDEGLAQSEGGFYFVMDEARRPCERRVQYDEMSTRRDTPPHLRREQVTQPEVLVIEANRESVSLERRPQLGRISATVFMLVAQERVVPEDQDRRGPSKRHTKGFDGPQADHEVSDSGRTSRPAHEKRYEGRYYSSRPVENEDGPAGKVHVAVSAPAAGLVFSW